MLLSAPLRLVLRLAGFLPVLIAPALVNWYGLYVTPPIWTQHTFDGMIEALHNGKTIRTADDLRAARAARMVRMAAPPDIMIFGGSRALRIAEDWFAPSTAINNAVLNGDLESSVALFELALQSGKTPRSVILELNPGLSHVRVQRGRYSLSRVYCDSLDRLHLPAMRRYLSLFSVQAFQSSLHPSRETEWEIGDTARGGWYRIFPDGTGSFGYDETTPEEVARFVSNLIAHWKPDPHDWRTSPPTKEDQAILRAFLDDLLLRHIEVTMFFAPVHPDAYPFYRKLGGYDDRWLRQEATSRGIRIVGSYSPADVHAAAADFTDDVHPRKSLLRRILSEAGVIAAR